MRGNIWRRWPVHEDPAHESPRRWAWLCTTGCEDGAYCERGENTSREWAQFFYNIHCCREHHPIWDKS